MGNHRRARTATAVLVTAVLAAGTDARRGDSVTVSVVGGFPDAAIVTLD
ncbi:hypothetical protein [Actinoplanes sp. NBRC 103695]|nr:hypothetical protein [Actinoplanes sp. NBRC 103695]GLZ00607.1 hypothetical protein Acsp02_78590 [Actinoplanes sp. NBRC 103695]